MRRICAFTCPNKIKGPQSDTSICLLLISTLRSLLNGWGFNQGSPLNPSKHLTNYLINSLCRQFFIQILLLFLVLLLFFILFCILFFTLFFDFILISIHYFILYSLIDLQSFFHGPIIDFKIEAVMMFLFINTFLNLFQDFYLTIFNQFLLTIKILLLFINRLDHSHLNRKLFKLTKQVLRLSLPQFSL